MRLDSQRLVVPMSWETIPIFFFFLLVHRLEACHSLCFIFDNSLTTIFSDGLRLLSGISQYSTGMYLLLFIRRELYSLVRRQDLVGDVFLFKYGYSCHCNGKCLRKCFWIQLHFPHWGGGHQGVWPKGD